MQQLIMLMFLHCVDIDVAMDFIIVKAQIVLK